MATFLDICKDVARDSGVVSTLDTPETVDGQSGRLARIVHWVREAYEDIQNLHSEWRWLEAEFSGSTIASTQSYDAVSLGITSRFSRWLYDPENYENFFTLYKTSEGQSTEQLVSYVDWNWFRRHYLIGSAATTTGKPSCVTVGPDDKLYLYPIPDDAYTLRGRYRKGLQSLTADADVPEMPEDYHSIIKWKALMLMGNFDEAVTQMPEWNMNYLRIKGQLENSQLKPVRMPDALA